MGQRGRNQQQLNKDSRVRSAGSSQNYIRSQWCLLVLLLTVVLSSSVALAHVDVSMEDFEGRQIASIEIVFENSQPDPGAQAEFLSLLRVAPNTEFSTIRIRESLQALFDSGRVANARVEAYQLNSD